MDCVYITKLLMSTHSVLEALPQKMPWVPRYFHGFSIFSPFA